ncbi:MAG: hypothetical protein Q8P67_28585 [archaeon]|nr:hypothetical protein [archaeon]
MFEWSKFLTSTEQLCCAEIQRQFEARCPAASRFVSLYDLHLVLLKQHSSPFSLSRPSLRVAALWLLFSHCPRPPLANPFLPLFLSLLRSSSSPQPLSDADPALISPALTSLLASPPPPFPPPLASPSHFPPSLSSCRTASPSLSPASSFTVETSTLEKNLIMAFLTATHATIAPLAALSPSQLLRDPSLAARTSLPPSSPSSIPELERQLHSLLAASSGDPTLPLSVFGCHSVPSSLQLPAPYSRRLPSALPSPPRDERALLEASFAPSLLRPPPPRLPLQPHEGLWMDLSESRHLPVWDRLMPDLDASHHSANSAPSSNASLSYPEDIPPLLERAVSHILRPDELRRAVLATAEHSPLLLSSLLQPSDLRGLVENNPELAYAVVVSLSSSSSVRDFLSALSEMPLSLRLLELASRLTKTLGLPLDLLTACSSRWLAACASMPRSEFQSRVAGLLSLFLQYLLLHNPLAVAPLDVQISSFSLELAHVPEAVVLFQKFKSIFSN